MKFTIAEIVMAVLIAGLAVFSFISPSQAARSEVENLEFMQRSPDGEIYCQGGETLRVFDRQGELRVTVTRQNGSACDTRHWFVRG